MSEAIAMENMMANHHVREQAMRTRFRNDRSRVWPQPIKTFHKALKQKTSPPLSLPPRKHFASATKVQMLVDVELSGMWDASSVVKLGVT
jgi:hypothetical protein